MKGEEEEVSFWALCVREWWNCGWKRGAQWWFHYGEGICWREWLASRITTSAGSRRGGDG